MFCLDIVILHLFDVMHHTPALSHSYFHFLAACAEDGGKVGVLKYVWRQSQWVSWFKVMSFCCLYVNNVKRSSHAEFSGDDLHLFEWKLSFAMALIDTLSFRHYWWFYIQLFEHLMTDAILFLNSSVYGLTFVFEITNLSLVLSFSSFHAIFPL